jgi:DNA-binding CsgD family transcriptional regulator
MDFAQEAACPRIFLWNLAGFLSGSLLFPLIMPLPGWGGCRFLISRMPPFLRIIVCILPFVPGRLCSLLGWHGYSPSPAVHGLITLHFCWQTVLGFGLFFLVDKMDEGRPKTISRRGIVYALALPVSIVISMSAIYCFRRSGENPAGLASLPVPVRILSAILDIVNFAVLFVFICKEKEAGYASENMPENTEKGAGSPSKTTPFFSAPVFRLAAAFIVFCLINGLYDVRFPLFFNGGLVPSFYSYLTLLGIMIVGYISFKKTDLLINSASSAAAIFFILAPSLLFSGDHTVLYAVFYSMMVFALFSLAVSMPRIFSAFTFHPYWFYLLMSAVPICQFLSFLLLWIVRYFAVSQRTAVPLASILALLFYFLVRNLRPPLRIPGIKPDNEIAVLLAPKPIGSNRDGIYAAFNFSRREQEISELLLRGFTRSKIAGHIFVSENTVKFHISHIYKKLGVDSRISFFARFANGEDE